MVIFISHLLSVLSLFFLLICLLFPFSKKDFIQKHRCLSKLFQSHALAAFVLLVLSFIHGLLAGNNPAMFSGKLLWTLILLTILFAFLKKLSMKFRSLHRYLAILITLLTCGHIIHALLV